MDRHPDSRVRDHVGGLNLRNLCNLWMIGSRDGA